MQDNRYTRLNQRLEECYSHLSTNFPLAYYYLETELRLLLTDQELAQTRNISNIVNKYSFTHILLTKIYFLTFFLVTKIKFKKRNVIFISLARHTDIKNKLSECAKCMDQDLMYNPSNYSEVLNFNNFFLIGHDALNSLTLKNLHYKIYENGLINVLDDLNFIQSLEDVLHIRIRSMQNAMKLIGIEGLILQNEHTFEEKIIVRAAKNLNIPIVTIAHGYVQQRELVSYAPFVADQLVLWTKSQKDFFDKFDCNFSRKTLYLGWPFLPLQINQGIHKKTLIVLTDIDNDCTEEEFGLTLDFIDNYLKKCRRTKIRLHPASTKVCTQRVNYIKTKYKAKLDIDHIDISLSSSQLVLGHDSSVLVTSVMNNIPTVRFEETAKAYMPEVTTLKMHQILDMPRQDLLNLPRLNEVKSTNLTELARSILKKCTQ